MKLTLIEIAVFHRSTCKVPPKSVGGRGLLRKRMGVRPPGNQRWLPNSSKPLRNSLRRPLHMPLRRPLRTPLRSLLRNPLRNPWVAYKKISKPFTNHNSLETETRPLRSRGHHLPLARKARRRRVEFIPDRINYCDGLSI